MLRRSHKRKPNDFIAIRSGDLAGQIDMAAKRNDRTRSDVVREALEMYLDFEPAVGFAMYLGASENFFTFSKAARDSNLLSEERFQHLYKALDAARLEIQKKLDALFAEIYPDKESLDSFFENDRAVLEEQFKMWQSKEWIEGSKKQREAMERRFEVHYRRPEPSEHIARWLAFVSTWFSRFPDLQSARDFLNSRRERMLDTRRPYAQRIRQNPAFPIE
jgi:hypothetical protein